MSLPHREIVRLDHNYREIARTVQAIGYDLRGRKQYRYHTLWSAARNETKFHRLYEFGKSLPALRLRIEQDLAGKELCREKVVAAVIALMERTYIRIGSENYEKRYGSHGISTLKDKHVTFQGSTMYFSFKGKKGIVQALRSAIAVWPG